MLAAGAQRQIESSDGGIAADCRDGSHRRTRLSSARPPPDAVVAARVSALTVNGAKLAKAAICLRLNLPNSGRWAECLTTPGQPQAANAATGDVRARAECYELRSPIRLRDRKATSPAAVTKVRTSKNATRPPVRTDSLLEQSDCLRCQAGGRVAHKVHSLWDRFKNPGCGLMDNPPLLHAGVGHGGLHGVLSRTMALRIVSILRNTAIRAAFGSTPRPSKRW